MTAVAKCARTFQRLTADSARHLIDSVDFVLTDCDGVLWNGNEAIPGAPETINMLREKGKKIFFVTNNSLKTRLQYAEKFKNLGIEVKPEEIICTAYVSALYLRDVMKYTGKVHLVGNPAIAAELQLHGIQHSGCEPEVLTGSTAKEWGSKPLDSDVKCVLVGFDPNHSYAKMVTAIGYLSDKDCCYIATNLDSGLPLGNGRIVPGTGSIVAGYSFASQREPEVMGKPSTHMFEVVKSRYPEIMPERTLMIGDRLDSDMLFANNCGMQSLWVQTGFSTLEEVQHKQNSKCADHKKQIPDYYTPNLADLCQFIKS